jgi:hypothetical protein
MSKAQACKEGFTTTGDHPMDTVVSSKLRLAVGVITAMLLWPSVNFAQVASSFSGDAIGAKGKIGTQSFEVDHLTLPSAGGTPTPIFDLDVKSIPGGCVGNCGDGGGINLTTTGSVLSSLTTADVGTFQVVIGGHTIIVSTAYSEASASCPVSMGDASETSWVGYVGSVTIDESYSSTADFPGGITDAQTFPIGTDGALGTVSVNQVISNTATASSGDIIVNAVQIDMTNGDQIVVGSSHAGVTCPKAPTGGGGGCKGKVTGGGVFMLNGKRQTFGLVAGTKKDGTSFGNFNYVDHGSGAHLQGNVQSVTVDPATSTTVIGTLKTGGAYTLVVMDNGEPGRDDTFNLISGPVSTGTIALDGGNIQLHKGCKK